MGRIALHKQILVIDDDRDLLEVLGLQLKHDGYNVQTAATGGQGLEMAVASNFDAIVLDLGLPDRSGREVCETIRTQGILTPILILSGDTEKTTIIQGLSAGADDYLVKPFYQDELTARLTALIRRDRRVFPAKRMEVDGVILNLADNTVEIAANSVTLTSLEAAVLRCLIQQAPEIVPREYFFEQVWGISDEHTSNRLDVYIKRVRKKLRQLPDAPDIQTVHSRGYRLGTS